MRIQPTVTRTRPSLWFPFSSDGIKINKIHFSPSYEREKNVKKHSSPENEFLISATCQLRVGTPASIDKHLSRIVLIHIKRSCPVIQSHSFLSMMLRVWNRGQIQYVAFRMSRQMNLLIPRCHNWFVRPLQNWTCEDEDRLKDTNNSDNGKNV